jgi:hypothetical protein
MEHFPRSLRALGRSIQLSHVDDIVVHGRPPSPRHANRARPSEHQAYPAQPLALRQLSGPMRLSGPPDDADGLWALVLHVQASPLFRSHSVKLVAEVISDDVSLQLE